MGTDDYVAQAAKLIEAGELWYPQADESVAGKVISIEDEILHLERCDNGNPLSIWCATLLKKAIDKQEVRAGDIVGIKYFGKRTSDKSGREFHLYILKVLDRASVEAELFEDDIPY